jgi:tetratricopeptide (TPR) repeat protein
MTFFQGTCPRCSTDIPKNRYVTGYAICACGWTDSTVAKKSVIAGQKQAVAVLCCTAVIIVIGYAHLVNWGKYALEIPVVKIQQITGTLSNDGYHELAQACMDLNKFTCVKNAYIGSYRQSGNMTDLASLAWLQTRLGEIPEALATYASYSQLGGKDAEALLRYGKVLEDAGQTELAFKTYEASIASKPEVLPVQATSAIVRMLMKQARYDEALERVTAFQASAGNAKGYLNTELAQLESHKASLNEAKSNIRHPKKKLGSAETPS